MGDGAGAYVAMLPLSLKNQRKVPYLSPPPMGQASLKIEPITEFQEKKILSCLLQELNTNFGLNLDTDPDHTRTSDPMTVTDSGRVVLVGASHMSRTAAAVAAAGGDVIDASSPGWAPSKDSCKKIANFLKNLALKDGDTLVIDVWSNLAFMGTDEYGIPCRSSKIGGKYHIGGHLQAAPRTVFQNGFNELGPVLEAAGRAAIVLIEPFPRYIVGKCCTDPSHITNFGSNDYEDEFHRAADTAESVASALETDFSMLRFTDLFAGNDSSLAGLQTAEGGPIWAASDPVHLTPAAYTELGAAIVASYGGSEAGRPNKRPRLESIVPAHPRGRGGCGFRGNLAPPPWVTGMASERGGSSGYGHWSLRRPFGLRSWHPRGSYGPFIRAPTRGRFGRRN